MPNDWTLMRSSRQGLGLQSVVWHSILLLVSVRPMIDLLGHYEGVGINAGGIIGGVVFGLSALLVFLRWSRPIPGLTLMLFAVTVIVALYCVFLVFASDNRFEEVVVSSNYIVSNDVKSAVILSMSRFMIGFAPLMLVVVALQDRPSQLRVGNFYFAIFLVCCVVPISLAWMQLAGLYPFTYFEWIDGVRYGRPSGGYFQPSSLGRLMVFLALFSFVFPSASHRGKALRVAAIVIASLTVVISTHRTSLVALLLVVLVPVVGAWVRGKWHITRTTRSVLLFAIPVAAVIATASLLNAGSARYVQSAVQSFERLVSEFDTASDLGEDRFLHGRGYLWGRTVEFVANASPMDQFLGIGWEPFDSHNDLLRILLVNGWLGLLMYAAILCVPLRRVWKCATGRGRVYIMGTMAYLVTFSMTYHPTAYPNFVWWFALGLLAVVTYHERSAGDLVA